MRGVSVITTLHNERDSLDDLVASLLAQSRQPDEIVVVDAGSSDGTAERLAALAAGERRLRVLVEPVGRSAGRNAAIRAATHDVIACIDGGCVAEPDWLERLTAPFEADPTTTFVAGFYRPQGLTTRSTCVGLVMVYVREEVDPDTFLPSARSMAFRRDAWASVGGFPEHLDFAEDTLFDERMVAAGHRPVFAGDAVVRWTPPDGYGALARTMARWGRGDGLAGLRGYTYKRLLAVYAGGPAAAVLLGVWRWWLAPLPLLSLGLAVARAVRHKLRWARGPARYVHLPVAHVVATLASLTGYVSGYVEARSRRGAPAAVRT